MVVWLFKTFKTLRIFNFLCLDFGFNVFDCDQKNPKMGSKSLASNKY